MIKVNYDPILGCTGWVFKKPDRGFVVPGRRKRNKKQKKKKNE